MANILALQAFSTAVIGLKLFGTGAESNRAITQSVKGVKHGAIVIAISF